MHGFGGFGGRIDPAHADWAQILPDGRPEQRERLQQRIRQLLAR